MYFDFVLQSLSEELKNKKPAADIWIKILTTRNPDHLRIGALQARPKINTHQAPNASKNQRWRVHVTVSVASWQVNLLRNITMQCSENNGQFFIEIRCF